MVHLSNGLYLNKMMTNSKELNINNTGSHSRTSEICLNYSSYLLVFILGWWACFILYPMWYVPGVPEARTYLFIILFIVLIVSAYLYRFLIASLTSFTPYQQEIPSDKGFFTILFLSVSIFHLPFINKPVISGLDTIDHAAIPAVVARKFINFVSRPFAFSIQPILAVCVCVIVIGLIFNRGWRDRLVEVFHSLSKWVTLHFSRAFIVLFLFSSLYCAVLLYYAIPERFGDLGPIFRYPPVSKINLIPLYIVFGLHEWLGRALQIFFTFAGAYYLYRLVLLFGPKDAAKLSAILYVFLPPVFHYGNTHMIDCGNLFFVIASFYYLILFLESKSAPSLLIGVLFCVFGVLYKHPVVSVIPAFTLMAIYDFLFPKKEHNRCWLQPFLACALASVAVLLYMKLSAFNNLIPSKLSFPTFDRLITNLSAVPQGVTLPVAVVFGLGLIYVGWRYTSRLFVFLLCWIGTHYILSAMSAAYQNVRQALPYYIGLLVAASFLADLLPKKYSIRAAVIYFIVPIYLLWACLFMDRTQNLEEVGRPMGDLSYINFSNWDNAYIPYDKAMRDLKERTNPGDVIYAPMTNEPSHFYIAKYNLFDRTYIRHIWEPPEKETIANLYDFCLQHNCDWLMVVRGKWLYSYANVELVEQLFVNPPDYFQRVTTYEYGDVDLGLWKIKSDINF